MKLAPIVLFVYNRPGHTRQTIEALKKNKLAEESELFIFSDAPKNEDTRESVEEVREYIQTILGFKKITIFKREKNWGLAENIIDGVTHLVNKYGKIIVLEDDLTTSPYFLEFMNEALIFYESDLRIMSVSGFNFSKERLVIPEEYSYDIYLSYRCMSWGWATWKERWNKIDWEIKDFEALKNSSKMIKAFNKGGDGLFDMLQNQMEGKIDSWAIRFCYAHFKNSMFCLYPVESLVNNEGFDGSGTHCKMEKSKYENISLGRKKITLIKDIELNGALLLNYSNLYRQPISSKIRRWIKRTFLQKPGLFKDRKNLQEQDRK